MYETLTKRFEKVIAIWKQVLEENDPDLLQYKPDEESWSLGQVYHHLIDGTRIYQFVKIDRCLAREPDEQKTKTEAGEKVLQNGAFPSAKIEVAVKDYEPECMADPAFIKEELGKMVEEYNEYAGKVAAATSYGKARHGILGYLDADEWLRLVEMHFRHHIRQKEALRDAYISNQV